MPADITTHRDRTNHSPLLHPLTLTFAGLTLLCAIFSMILGNRVATLQADYLKAEEESATSEAASLKTMEASLNAATAKLNTAHQTLAKEKSVAEQLRRKLAAVIKDLEKSQTELAIANQTIRDLNSTQPTEKKPSLNTAEPAQKPQTDSSAKSVVTQEPAPQGAASPTTPSSPQPAPAQPPATTVPAPTTAPTPQQPAPNPDNQVDQKTFPATEPTISENRRVVDEKTIADLPEAPPAAPTSADD